ncbi:hypothetical protein V496_09322 [Pseudogymnoascus sp. VKM F-4515 (FW-2607)]|nr:hypothetical protein V496_09322 [Pseudogymnoascus sp. VKM F-4515 (FW-2607)]KFY84880.1 hypothetical protein V498_07781 [Pseudogymnoascus sp. VKM F-4517 (FW-2822)]
MNEQVDLLREREYPMLKDEIYLDHAGTTLYAKSLMERFATEMISNLYGNPHSASPSSQASTARIDDVRIRVLEFFNADPVDFDVVFVANATAGIKLVMDAFRSRADGFTYAYHSDSHTSLVGVRETAAESFCLGSDDVEAMISGSKPLFDGGGDNRLGLFAYPAQSNMNGRRLPLRWPGQLRSASEGTSKIYTLLDAAALVSTSKLDLSDVRDAPDFTVLSFNKIFGFPDLGALIVRRDSADVLQSRKYFGGGTVETIACIKEQWHEPKVENIHASLEDGTLPMHNIMALGIAMDVHKELYTSMDRISEHTLSLAQKLYSSLRLLKHANGADVCRLYVRDVHSFEDNSTQGPIVTFNLMDSHGAWVSNTEVEKLATVRKIHIRTGGLCNPGGVAKALDLSPWEIRRNFSAGYRCGGDNDIIAGKPTGVIRASLGAMSTLQDIDRFIELIDEFYVEKALDTAQIPFPSNTESTLYVESLTIFPIKSCGGLPIPPATDWEVRPEGLAWDREWCLVHKGTGQALSQKRYPRMALLRPSLNFATGHLIVTYLEQVLVVPLADDPTLFEPAQRALGARVCGDNVAAQTYAQPHISAFFSDALDVPCTLARFPAGGTGLSTRHSKTHMQRHQRSKRSPSWASIPGAYPPTPPDSDTESAMAPRPILLSNESPILLVHRASLDALNATIRSTGGKEADAAVFRGNVVVGSKGGGEAYAEDQWGSVRIGGLGFKMLGACRRCYMVCVDQGTGVKDEEPFVTLARTRRFEGKLFFGGHMCVDPGAVGRTIRVGDVVEVDGGGL